ncbi:MAG: hypothetical protein HY072_01060 [Deltaproteobacteria bacterium]|nr:hypothetical protein [Deltaproteobacteria bacterium]
MHDINRIMKKLVFFLLTALFVFSVGFKSSSKSESTLKVGKTVLFKSHLMEQQTFNIIKTTTIDSILLQGSMSNLQLSKIDENFILELSDSINESLVVRYSGQVSDLMNTCYSTEAAICDISLSFQPATQISAHFKLEHYDGIEEFRATRCHIQKSTLVCVLIPLQEDIF